MAKNRCIGILEDMKNMATKVQYSDENPFQNLFEMTLAGDANRLKLAKDQLKEATKKHDNFLRRDEALSKNILVLEENLKNLEKKYEEVRSGKFVSNSTLELVERLKEQILIDKTVLKMYREGTGTRLVFNGPNDMVAGYVAVTGDDPSESKLEPFQLKKSTGNIPNELWKKISEVSETGTVEIEKINMPK